jgi:group II intron reverse transcriptase/maturase
LPQAILGVEIPKGNGKTRLLGIPTVTDRLLQQAVLQAITPRFEFEFSDSSFGFRPNRNVGQAVLKAQGYINGGFQHIVDIDLQTFFDEVDHCYLLQLLYRKIKCRQTLRLIPAYRQAGANGFVPRSKLTENWSSEGKACHRACPVPKVGSSPLSPLLSNIMLHELDRELERQGLRFVRYADDFSIYVKTKAEARKVGNNIYKFLKKKLKLPINREKSGIRRPVHFTCLGFGFVPTYKKRRTRQVSTGSVRKELGEAKAKAQNPYPKNHPNEF